MNKSINDLFDDLAQKKKERNHSEELQSLSVRLTPEVGLMLKLLSEGSVLNFPVASVFRKLMSNELHMITTAKYGGNSDLSELNELLNEVVNQDGFIEDAYLNNSVDLIYDSEFIDFTNPIKEFFERYKDKSDSSDGKNNA